MLIIQWRQDATEAITRLVVDYIERGRLAVLPTETVYGLVATIRMTEAVKRIYEIKARGPIPLTVHVDSLDRVPDLVMSLPREVEDLLQEVWPGPLTVVLWRSDAVPDIVTAGSRKVGIRAPAHVLTLEVLRRVGPCVMPSANKHGNPSPVDVQDVIEDLGGEVDLIVDAGPCSLGIDSTVVDFTEKPPRLLRAGALPVETLKQLGFEVELPEHLKRIQALKQKFLRDVKVIAIYSQSIDDLASKLVREVQNYISSGYKLLIVVSLELFRKVALPEGRVDFFIFGTRRDIWSFAKSVYKVFRHCAHIRPDVVLFECPPPEGVGLAVLDRILAAADQVV